MQSPTSLQRPVSTKWHRQMEDVRQKRDNLADRQHHYAKRKGEASKRRAAELEQADEKREKDGEALLAREKEIGEKR